MAEAEASTGARKPLCCMMPRKPNYGFEKRRKEQERQKKTEAKLQEKQRRKDEEARARGDEPPPVGEGLPAE